MGVVYSSIFNGTRIMNAPFLLWGRKENLRTRRTGVNSYNVGNWYIKCAYRVRSKNNC